MKSTDANIFLAGNCRDANMPKVQQNSLDTEFVTAPTVETKVCRKCNKTLSTKEFRISSAGHKDGHIPYCRLCEREVARQQVKPRKLPTIPSVTAAKISPEYTPLQMTKDQARALFDYEPRNGDLLWRATDRRVIPRLHSMVARDGVHFPMFEADAGDGPKFYRLHVLIWNWHKGVTDMAVIWKDGNRLNNRVQNLREVAPIKIYEKPGDGGRRHNRYAAPASLREPIRCPCCFQEVWRPTLEAVADMADLQPMEQRILGAIWAGSGMPVDNERIFTAMYEDDPDGGPEPAKMYSAMKVALSNMRGKLRGTGVNVESNGYGRGYRLVLGE